MPKSIDIDYGIYAAKWSLTDFYEESKDKLISAIASGKPFETSWGCSKEIRYAAILKRNTDCIITVDCHMDDLWESDDLIYDALWERCQAEEELPEDILESIREEAADRGLNDTAIAQRVLPANATFEDICNAITEMEDECEAQNSSMFNTLKDIVEEQYKFIHA